MAKKPSGPTPVPRSPVRPARGIATAHQIGSRVFLRHPTSRDRSEYVKLRDISESFHAPWEPLLPDGSRLEPDDAFDRFMDSADTPASQRFLICRVDDGAMVGQVSLNQIFRGPFQNCMMGYWIGAPFARMGYMSEAIALALRHAFETLQLHRCEANIVPENAASKGLVRKLGFRFEGLAAKYLQIAGRWRDHEHWALTREDWDAGAGRAGR